MSCLKQVNNTLNLILFGRNRRSLLLSIPFGQIFITEHLGADANVGVDVLACQEFGVPRNGVIESR